RESPQPPAEVLHELRATPSVGEPTCSAIEGGYVRRADRDLSELQQVSRAGVAVLARVTSLKAGFDSARLGVSLRRRRDNRRSAGVLATVLALALIGVLLLAQVVCVALA